MKRRYLLAFIASFAATLLLAMGGTFAPLAQATPPGKTTLLISAAASLQDALEAIDPLFELANDNIRVNYNFGSSGALQQQIEQGAPADVFISAATKQMEALQAQNLILNDTRRNLVSNRLVLIVPKNSTLDLTSFRQLAEADVKRISVGEFRSVPAGQYAEEVFKNLGILEQLQPKLVFANNVRGVLAAVESGNVDAGIVYTTDAKTSDRILQVATAPENLHSPIIYPLAVLKNSKNAEAAKTYGQYLSSSRARSIFERFGFGIPNS